MTLALPLAVEAIEPGVMSRPPRPPRMPVIGRLLIVRTVVVGLLMTVAALLLFELRNDQTIVVTTIVLFQVFYLVECRSLRHSIFHVGLPNPGGPPRHPRRVVQGVFFYYSSMKKVVGGAPHLAAKDGFPPPAPAATVLPVVGAEKWWRRRDRSFPPRKPRGPPMTGRAVGGTIIDNVS